jgi:hypothetical protein
VHCVGDDATRKADLVGFDHDGLHEVYLLFYVIYSSSTSLLTSSPLFFPFLSYVCCTNFLNWLYLK